MKMVDWATKNNLNKLLTKKRLSEQAAPSRWPQSPLIFFVIVFVLFSFCTFPSSPGLQAPSVENPEITNGFLLKPRTGQIAMHASPTARYFFLVLIHLHFFPPSDLLPTFWLFYLTLFPAWAGGIKWVTLLIVTRDLIRFRGELRRNTLKRYLSYQDMCYCALIERQMVGFWQYSSGLE